MADVSVNLAPSAASAASVAAKPKGESAGLLSPAAAVAAIGFALLPFHFFLSLTPGTGAPMADPVLSLQDLLFMTVGVLGSVWILTNRRRSSPVAKGLLVFWALVAITFAFHPSMRGGLHLLRLLALPALVHLCTRPKIRAQLATVFVASTVASALVALAQRFRGGPLGLGMIGERTDPFLSLVPGFPTPQAFTGHPYHAGTMFAGALGVLCIAGVKQQRFDMRLAAPACVLALAAAQSSSRMLIVVLTALGLVLGVAALTSRTHRRAALVLAVAVAIPTIAWVGVAGGSYDRPSGDEKQSLDSLSNGRGALLRQSIDIWQSAPMLGVGPGNYVDAQRNLGLPQIGPWPIVVHSYPLQVLSESGVVGVVGLTAAVAAMSVRLRRLGRSAVLPTAIVVVVAGPMALLDHAMYTFGFAAAVLALLIGSATSGDTKAS
jgi:hypothetical protein